MWAGLRLARRKGCGAWGAGGAAFGVGWSELCLRRCCSDSGRRQQMRTRSAGRAVTHVAKPRGRGGDEDMRSGAEEAQAPAARSSGGREAGERAALPKTGGAREPRSRKYE